MVFFRFCAKTPVILLSLVAMLVLGYCFTFVQAAMGDLTLLDMLRSAQAAQDQLAAMPEDAKRAHMVGTATLDTGYPLSIMMFTGGLIYRFAPQPLKAPLVFIPIAATSADYAENISILLALAGQTGIIEFKTLMTTIKFPAFGIAFLLALLCLLYGTGKAIVRMVTRPKNTSP